MVTPKLRPSQTKATRHSGVLLIVTVL